MMRISTLHAIERVLLATILLLAATEAVAQSDVAGSHDHALFNRMPGFWIEDYETSDFNSRVFLVKTTGDEWEEKTVEGRKTEITYRIKEGAREPSSLQVVRNYANAAAQAGGKVVYENNDPGNRVATLLLEKGGREVWVEVRGSDGGGWYTLATVRARRRSSPSRSRS